MLGTSDWSGNMTRGMRLLAREARLTDEVAGSADSFEWVDFAPFFEDHGDRTLFTLPELAKRIDLSEERLQHLLNAGKLDGTWTEGQWLVTPAAVADSQAPAWARDLEVKPEPFTPRPRYSSAGDCLFFYFREDKSWADRVDELLTVYRAFDSKQVVGFKLKNVELLKERLGPFLIQFETREVSIHLLFTHMLRWKLKGAEVPHTTVALTRKYAEAIEAVGELTARLPALT